MHNKTKSLKIAIRSKPSLKERIDVLLNAYQGEDCYILTAGPSINELAIERLREVLRGKLVIAVKQTFDIIPEHVDFHVINPYNYQIYDFKGTDPVRIIIDGEGSTLKTPNYEPDMAFEIEKTQTGHRDKSLAARKDFSKYELDHNLLRPWGPGIMYEIVLYLPVLFGCKNLFIIGWDLGRPDTEVITRFYKKKSISGFLGHIIYKRYSELTYNRYMKIINVFRTLLSSLGINIRLNEPAITKNEAKFIASSTKSLYEYLTSRNINARIISDTSMVDPIFPRVEL